MKIAVIGSGRWGTFIAWYLDNIGHEVTLYGKADSLHMAQLLAKRTNGLVALGDRIRLVTDLSRLCDAELIGISIGSQGLRALCGELRRAGLDTKPLILCMKGIEIETGMRLSEVVASELPKSAGGGLARTWTCAGICAGYTELHGDRFSGRSV